MRLFDFGAGVFPLLRSGVVRIFAVLFVSEKSSQNPVGKSKNCDIFTTFSFPPKKIVESARYRANFTFMRRIGLRPLL